MKFWQSIAFAEAEHLTGIAKIAEDLGFFGVINSDHLFLTRATGSDYPYTQDGKMTHSLDCNFTDVWCSFAAMAAVTTRLQFTSSVYLLPLRNPIEVAKMAGACALISGNRVAVGFGVGWQKEEFEAMGVDFHTRGKRTDEMIEVMRKIWDGGIISHHGRFFNFDQIEVQPVPSQTVPLYCGGISHPALQRAATLCDGYVGPGHRIEDVPALIAELNRLRAEAGRGNLPFETIIPILPIDLTRGADDYKRLEDMGVTATFLPPFNAAAVDRGRTTGLGAASTLGDKKRFMERFAENIISKM